MKVEIRPCLWEVRKAARRFGLTAKRHQNQIVLLKKVGFSGKFSEEQLRTQESMGLAGLAWSLMTPEVRKAWDAYAERYESHYARQSANRLQGRWFYSGAAIRRLMLASDPPTEKPLPAPPPPAPGKLDLLPADGLDNTLRIRLRHRGATAGVLLVARISRPMARLSNKPNRRESPLICGFHPASAVPMPTSGEVATFENARFAIEPGERFGLWLYAMRVSDGVASRESYYDLVRG